MGQLHFIVKKNICLVDPDDRNYLTT